MFANGSRLTKFRKKNERFKIYFEYRQVFFRGQILSNGRCTQCQSPLKIWSSDSRCEARPKMVWEHDRRECVALFSQRHCVASCRRFTKLRIFNTFDYKYRQNLVSKITNSDKSQTPQFRETAVSGRIYFHF